MTYDDVGNLESKTVSVPAANPAVAARTVTDEYELSKRFVKKKTDHQGFVSLLEYTAMGQVKKSTDYLGVVNEFAYDNWGKLSNSVSTGGSATPRIVTNSYFKNPDGGYTVEQNTSGTNEMSRTVYDVMGNVIKTSTKGFAANSIISKTIEYDVLGRKQRESDPYFSSPGKWTTFSYDYLHRPIQITTSSDRIQAFDYSQGLKTITIDSNNTKTVTLDALGNKVQTSDNGGEVNHTYYATGELRKSNYDGHEITIGIDGWGNKISMLDPNAGTTPYTYDYDAFGQLKRESTPKGYTEYAYDDYGKLIAKKVSGDGADYNTIYSYNSFAQLENETAKTSANVPVDSYVNTYDNFHRLTGTTENNADLEHTKTITYDAFGRPDVETNYTREKTTANFQSTVSHRYEYNGYNGMMAKISNPADGSALWQLDSANEKMQVLMAHLGNGATIVNTYDHYSNYASQQHSKNGVDLLNNQYDFQGPTGNLNNRQNNAMGLDAESFEYDFQNRLETWTNLTTGFIDFNRYDNRGRIIGNTQLGTVNYKNPPLGIYQKTNIKLSPSGIGYYGALGGNQVVSYTMFKSPISINESNKGKVSFEYNSHLSRAKMAYDYRAIAPGTVKDYRKTKLYADDGAAEVILDKAANTIKIRTYIGGDAYSAIAYNDKTIDRSSGAVTEAKYYLHRDYLGSILAISDANGNAVEKRHFDAWGNLVKAVDASNSPIDGLQFFDRGYTGHEHLQEVRLIHMNGRLYDPVLKSFLMPDNYVQAPENTQSYNRYAYCLNNPLLYSDPDGEFWVEAGIAAVVALVAYLTTNYATDQPINFRGAIKATTIGAISGAVTFGMGSLAGSLFSNFYSVAAASAVGHGLFQGGMSSISGGSFWSGAAAGAIASLASSAWSGGSTNSYYESVDRTFTTVHTGIGGALGMNTTAGMIAFGTLAGGLGAELTGGDFWVGAATGLVVSGLNHASHGMDDGEIGFDKNGNQINDNGGMITDYLYDDNGEIIASTPVAFRRTTTEGFSRGYGYYGYKLASGGINEDNRMFGFYAGGKIAGTAFGYLGDGLNAIKVPAARWLGAYIGEFAPGLNKGSGLRIGISKANIGKGGTKMVFRATYGNNKNHIFNIVIGKWGN